MFPRGACTSDVIKEFLKYKLENNSGIVLFDGFSLDHSVSDETL